MDEKVVKQFIEQLAAAFHPPQFDNSFAIQEVARKVDSVGSSLMSASGHLNTIASRIGGLESVLNRATEFMHEIGSSILQSSVVVALQEENGKLTMENSVLRRRQDKIILLLKDLASPCVGCKKAQWAPHAGDCDWRSDIYKTLDGLAHGESQQATTIHTGETEATG